ncbi:type III secretion system protein [Vibrio parahaemolyticus]|nr:type III secretion system protein [Vibrio parahaemolyticus]EGQ8700298.1 type III secretion system protein [Vibrio parahaemolyticus]EGQ8750354.1 type III secretion system protein [Vibrio parahaemolyticus]EGQ8759283.1 type III secretion system protein [Vibrio parahaemolyticus]EGQ8774034.1 type III secretion system protein [Vibrio parahaemolyticus]
MKPISINTADSANVLAQEATNHNASVSVDAQQWQQFDSSLEKASQGGVSMSELLALLSQIISSAKELRSQVMQSRIDEAKATTELAIVLADDRRSDAQMKFGISLASSVMNMALTTASSVRIGQTKTLKDKHLSSMSGNGDMKVSDLSMKDLNKFTAQLQQARTAKYNTVSQSGNMANSMVGNANDIINAEEVKHQEEGTASKQLKEKVDAHLDQFIQELTTEAVKLNEILDLMARASLVTNR